MENKSVLVVQMIYIQNFYINILGISIETSTSGKIKLFAKNKIIIEPYNIEDTDKNIKVIRTTTYLFDVFFFFNFIANNNMIDKDAKVLKNSLNMEENTSLNLT